LVPRDGAFINMRRPGLARTHCACLPRSSLPRTITSCYCTVACNAPSHIIDPLTSSVDVIRTALFWLQHSNLSFSSVQVFKLFFSSSWSSTAV